MAGPLRRFAALLVLVPFLGCRWLGLQTEVAAPPPAAGSPALAPAPPPAPVVPPVVDAGPKVTIELPPQMELDAALREIGRRTETVLVADASVKRAFEAKEVGLWLRLKDFPRDAVVPWLARSIRAYAVPRPDSHVLLTRRDDWMKQDELKIRVPPDIRGLFTEPDGRDLVDAFEAAVFPVTKIRSEARIAFEPTQRSIMLNVPDFAYERIERVIRALRAEEKAFAPAPEPALPDARIPAMEMKSATLPEVLDRLAVASGVNLGCELDDATRRSISIPAGPLSDALIEVCRSYERDAPRAIPGQGVWIGRKPGPKDPPSGGWHPYLRAEVRAYSLVGITGPQGVGGIDLKLVLFTTEALIKTLSPCPPPAILPSGGFAFGGGRCFFIHKKTNRLVVIHEPEIQQAVAAHLARLEAEGAKRLYGEPGPGPAKAP